jgi:hypothetical protein
VELSPAPAARASSGAERATTGVGAHSSETRYGDIDKSRWLKVTCEELTRKPIVPIFWFHCCRIAPEAGEGAAHAPSPAPQPPEKARNSLLLAKRTKKRVNPYL